MEQNMFNLNNKIYSNNNKLLIEIINDLNQLMNYYKDNISINILGNVINKINYIINENKKNLQPSRNDIPSLCNQMNKRFDELKINNINKQELKWSDGSKYIGQVVNGLAEGKGTWYGTKEPFIGDRYEGEFRNNKFEGKGIYYYNNEPWKDDRYEGEWRNGKKEGKGIYYYNDGDIYEGDFRNGNRYEGDWRNDKLEGKGIMYYNNGDREMGDFYNDKQIGKFVMLKINGEVKIINY